VTFCGDAKETKTDKKRLFYTTDRQRTKGAAEETNTPHTDAREKKARENTKESARRWRKDLAEEEEEEEKKKEKELRKLFFQRREQNLRCPNRKSKRDKRNVEAFWKR
jgi:hypothetical protein